MKLDIHELFDSWEDQDLELTPQENISEDAVLKRTLRKMGRKSHHHIRWRRAVLAAAACLALAASVTALIYRTTRFERVDGLTITWDGEERHVNKDTVLTFTPSEDTPEQGTIMGVLPNCLPFTPYIGSQTLRNSLTHLEGEVDQDLLSQCTLADEMLDGAYTFLCAKDDQGIVYNVHVYSSGVVRNKQFMVWGDNVHVEEGTFLGMEATWMTQDLTYTYGTNTSYQVVLYNAAYDCVIYIGVACSTGEPGYDMIGYDMLKPIAESVELVDTGIPSMDPDPDWNWRMLGVGVG